MKTIEQSRGLDRLEIIKGIIKEMSNYGYVEEYMGKVIVEVINILEQEE